MFDFYYQHGGARRKLFKVKGSVCSIGSARSNDLILETRMIGKRHAEFRVQSDGVYLKDLGSLGGSWVNRERIVEHGPLSDLDEVVIGDVNIVIDSASVANQAAFHVSGIDSQDYNVTSASRMASGNESFKTDDVDERLAYWGGIVHEQLLHQMDLRRKDVNRMTDEQLRKESLSLIGDIIASLENQMPKDLDKITLSNNVLNESVGLGPLEQFLEDEEVTEIMVNNHRETTGSANRREQPYCGCASERWLSCQCSHSAVGAEGA